MIEAGLGPGDIDTATPNVARIYDFLLGGKDNFAADRDAAQQLLAAIPDVAAIIHDNRAFVGRVVRFLAGQAGISQFLDLGAGLPTQENLHETAQRIRPDARVVYVDNDPVVWCHGQALLASRDRTAMVHGDLREPQAILRNPEVTALLDLTQPVALLCTSALHFVSDADDPEQIIAGYRDRMAPGSYLVITHGPTGTPEEDPAGEAQSATAVYRRASAQLHVRSPEQIRRLFEGFDLIDPGIVWITRWRPDPGIPPAGRPRSLRGAVGRKP